MEYIGLGHVAIRTRDIEKSARFYTEIMGMKEAFRMHREDGSLATIYLYIAPGRFIELFDGGTEEHPVGPQTIGLQHICLEVPDLKAAMAELKAKGAPIDTDFKVGKSRCYQFWTHDPDGTRIEMMELPPESLQAEANRRFR